MWPNFHTARAIGIITRALVMAQETFHRRKRIRLPGGCNQLKPSTKFLGWFNFMGP